MIKLESLYAIPVLEDSALKAQSVRLSAIFTKQSRSVYIDLPADPYAVAEALKVLAMKIEAMAQDAQTHTPT